MEDKDTDSTSEHRAINKPVTSATSSSSESTSQGISTETQRDHVRIDDHTSKMRSKDSQTSLHGKGSFLVFNPFSPSTDQHLTSPHNITVFSNRQVVRIK